MKSNEDIINSMTAEERRNPQLFIQFGGKKVSINSGYQNWPQVSCYYSYYCSLRIIRFVCVQDLVTAAAQRRINLAQISGKSVDEVEQFLLEFNNMRKMMKKQLKGMDMEANSEVKYRSKKY